MTEEQKCFKEHFLESEVRDGVEVSVDLKKVWKVLLDILEEFIKVCEKHNLEWTLEGGSLLGAVRHKGFIPWDDDIDVVMPRKDYDRFVKVAQKDFPEHIFLQTTATDVGFHIPHVMVRDSRTTGIDPCHVKWGKRFNMGIRIDVLALDGMPKSNFARSLVAFWIKKVSGLVPRENLRFRDMSFGGKLKSIFGKVLFSLLGRRGVYCLRELPLRLFPMSRCEWCGSLVARNFWHPHSIRRSEWFNQYVEMPFEYLTVPVPKEYDKILTQQFKEWRTPVRGGAWHGELYFDVEKDYKIALQEKFGVKVK